MDITQETYGSAVILKLNGRIDSRTSIAFEEALTGVFDGGATRVLLDFSDVAFLSSAGLRVLLMGAKRANAVQGKLICSGMAVTVYEVFDKCGMTTMIRHLDTRGEAIRYLV